MISLILWALAAFFNSVMDTLSHHYSRSIFNSEEHFPEGKHYFWDPYLSWKNKYKDNDKWYGWINDTILVWTTDGWHLAQMLMKSCLVLAIVFYKPIITWYWDILVLTVTWGLIFELFYKYILIKLDK